MKRGGNCTAAATGPQIAHAGISLLNQNNLAAGLSGERN
jgi:hypothetical protein